MARTRNTTKRTTPLPPELPDEFVASPARLSSHDVWEGVAADAELAVDELVADAQLIEVVLTGCDLSGRRFTGLHARDVRLAGCDLSGAVLDGASLDRVLFTGCRLTGAMLSGTRMQDVQIIECSAPMVNLRAAQARYLFIRDTALVDGEFATASFADSAILDCDLTRADVSELRARGLALHGSRLDDLVGATSLAGVRIDAEQVLPLGVLLALELGIRQTDRPD
jgi:uncharacterized protein YjbI with pentapeptide repeats